MIRPHGPCRSTAARHLVARWPGPTKDFTQRMARIERLLQERSATTPDKRKAHFVSALSVAWPDDHLEEVEARADARCVWPPRGTAASAMIRCSCRMVSIGLLGR